LFGRFEALGCNPFAARILAHDVGVGKFRCAFLTQKERDNESGLDYFGARYYSSVFGRFMSCDPILGNGPQVLNRYAYVKNNPMNRLDLSGGKDLSAQEASFVRQFLPFVLRAAIHLKASAGGIFAVASYESYRGTGGHYPHKGDVFGMNGGKLGGGKNFETPGQDFADFESLIRRRYAHAIGVQGAKDFIDALQSGGTAGRGYKWNSEPGKDYAGILKSHIENYAFQYFDEEVLTPLGKGSEMRRPSENQIRPMGKMLHWALVEIRGLGTEGKSEQAADLPDAFHSLPAYMFSADF
jgi:RHS repeat-associated protein